MIRLIALCLGLAAPLAAQQSLPDKESFLEALRKTLRSDRYLLSQYTYTEREIEEDIDSDGRTKGTKINVYEVFPGENAELTYRRQTVRDGAPVPAAAVAQQDRSHQTRLAKALRRSRRGAADDADRQREREARETRILTDLFAMYDFTLVGRESLGEHSTVIVSFSPKPSVRPRTREGGYFRKIGGRAWISEKDSELVRVEAEVLDNISFGGILARLNKGTRFTAERRQFNHEVWLPFKTSFSGSARLMLVKGLRKRVTTEYYDHRKFSVETKLTFGTEKQP